MTGLRVIQVEDAAQRNMWLRMPWTVMGDDPAFVAPLIMLEKRRISTKHNPFFEFAETALFLALRDGRPVGRISAQVNRRSNEHRGEKAAHFGFFDCLDDPEAAIALVDAAAAWGATRGMSELLGPFNFSINQECGALVEGFDSPAALMMPQGLAHYDRLLHGAGLTKAIDLLAFRMDPKAPRPPVERILERVTRMPEIGIRLLDLSRLRQEIDLVLDIFNDAWAENWGYVPMSPAEIDEMARNLKLLLRPQAAAFVTINGKEEAMMVALPDLNALTRDFDGGLFPFNIVRLLGRLKSRQLPSARVVLMGVRRRHHGGIVGGTILARLVGQIRKAAVDMGLNWIEFSWILETNRPVTDLCERLSGPPVKRYRIYRKSL